MNEEWRAAKLQGWGPDVTEILLQCPDMRCTWEHTFDDTVTLDEIHDELTRHMKEVHGGS